MKRVLHVVTGPSGAGKSAYSRQQPDWEFSLYNLDDRARLRGGVGDAHVREQAWGEIVSEIRADIERRKTPIVLDHILDTRAIKEILEPAKALGYALYLNVVCPGNSEACVERIERRKTIGGHGRSPHTVRQLYEDAMHVAAEASVIFIYCNFVLVRSLTGWYSLNCVRGAHERVTKNRKFLPY